jgi:hypothetical protein
MKFAWDALGGRTLFVVGLLALLVIPAVLAYMGLGIVALLFALPILAWIASRLLVHGGSEALSWMSREPLGKWEGTYYAFNDVQIRIFEDDGRLWFVVGDVMYAIGMKKLPDSFRAVHPRDVRVVPGTRLKSLDPAGLERLLGKRNEHEAIRFLTWMRREVVKPWERKRAG